MLKKIRSFRRMVLLFLIILCLLLCALTLPRLLARSKLARKKLAARLMQRHLGAMAWACGLKIHIRGELPPEPASFVLLANHVSYWDIIALGSLRPMGFMAKDSIAGWPFLGAVTKACNTIYVKREETLDRWRALREMQQKSQDLPYCVFPEGTTTAAVGPKLSNWRRGNVAVLRKPGIPIWLAGLHYLDHEKQAWIDDDALLPHIWKVLQAPSIHLMVHFKELEANLSDPLHQLSLESWSQTIRLCKNARLEVLKLAPAAKEGLWIPSDSAVS